MSASKKYDPINCSLYDYLEMWAIKKTPLEITYKEGNESKHIEHVLIVNLQTKEKEEFVYLNSGKAIRLDKILRVNDVDFTIRSC